MEQKVVKESRFKKLFDQKSKWFVPYVIIMGINFSLFTAFALLWVGLTSFNNVIAWEGWIAILTWALLLVSLIIGILNHKLGFIYLIIELLVIIAFGILSENLALAFFFLLLLLCVAVPYIFVNRKQRK